MDTFWSGIEYGTVSGMATQSDKFRSNKFLFKFWIDIISGVRLCRV